MSDLIVIKNRQAVTTSLQVAETFEKEIKHVNETIRNLTVENPAVKNFFYEGTYKNSRGRDYPMYYMNRDGFTLLAMGFNGKKALEFKVKYIEAFNQMEQALTEQQPQGLELALQAALQHEREIKSIKLDVDYLKGSMRVDTLQQRDIQNAASRSVVQALGGKESNAYQSNSVKTKAFTAFWREFKDYFKVPRYGDLPKSKYDEALRFIQLWRPSTSLQMEIDSWNSQMAFEG